MLYIYTGTDNYTKTEHLQELAKKLGISPSITPVENLESTLSGGDLFASVKLFKVLDSNIESLESKLLELLKASNNHYVFFSDKLDQRKKSTKEILGDKKINHKSFEIPSGEELKVWINNYLKKHNSTIDSSAQKELLYRLGYEENANSWSEVKYNLFQVKSELEKLIIYSDGKITVQAVRELVPELIDIEIFTLINSLASKNRVGIVGFLDRFFATGEEKAKTIQLAAAAAEQFRNLLLVKVFVEERVGDSEIISRTGWKPGRLSILRKLSSNFTTTSLKNALKKFEHLDIELKSSTTPPRVIFDLILTQFI